MAHPLEAAGAPQSASLAHWQSPPTQPPPPQSPSADARGAVVVEAADGERPGQAAGVAPGGTPEVTGAGDEEGEGDP